MPAAPPDVAQLIKAHAARFGPILKRHQKGQKLKPADLKFLSPPSPQPSPPGEGAGAHDTIGSAATSIGVPRSLISKARKAGAPGFKGSRVYLSAELLKWLVVWLYETSGLNEAEKHRKAIDAETLRKKRFENDKASGAFLEKGAVDTLLLEIAERIKTVLRSRLKNDLPPKLEGLRAPEIAAKMDPVVAELIECLR